MEFTLKQPTEIEFEQITNYINQFELDNRKLQKEDFILAVDTNHEILGFGRLRKHKNCSELCSLGVITPHRLKGIGKAIVKELVKSSNNSIFLVCIIPDFFNPLGFSLTKDYPPCINDKINYCTEELVVPETYVAMKYIG